MNNNLKFWLKLSDYLGAVVTGTLTASALAFLLPDTWPMPLAMLVGMAFGFIAMILTVVLFVSAGGLFQLIMPGMVVGMAVGMFGGMWVSMESPDPDQLIAFGFLAGLYLHAVLHMYDRSLHGEVARPGER